MRNLMLTLLLAAVAIGTANITGLPWDTQSKLRELWLADIDTLPGGSDSSWTFATIDSLHSTVVEATRFRGDGSLLTGVGGVAETQIFYVGKHGSNTNNGKSLRNALLTHEVALESVMAHTPVAGNEYAVICMDAGMYTESCSIPSFTHVYAPNAQFRGQWKVTDNSMFEFNGISCGAGSTAVSKLAGSGEAHIKFDNVTGTGTASGFICTAGAMQARGGVIDVENGFGFGASSTNNMHIRCSRISVSGTGYAIGTLGAGTVRADVNAIVAASGTGIYAASNANVYVTAATIVAGTAYNVAAATDSMWITCPSITGTRTSSGTVVEISNASVTTNKGVFNDSARTPYFKADSIGNTTVVQATRFRGSGANVTGVIADSSAGGATRASLAAQATIADSSTGGATRASLAADATLFKARDTTYFSRLGTVAAHTAQYYSTEVSDSCSGAAATIDFAAGNVHRVKLNSGANTLTLSNGAAGGRYLLLLKQPSGGAAGTVTFSPVPLWPSATAPTLSTTNDYLDIVTFAYSGVEAKYVGSAALDLR